ncbi:hypothetical protein E3N88_01926 [Mikania micrantha]|uniref:Uncharacterized protein n=1 Tax=Mikania micrantha TaxID=192012 RepID=A0A5N6Q530_9ASTR|nr:hypothetical protein E3N88_01926 [Mikania micrantha]
MMVVVIFKLQAFTPSSFELHYDLQWLPRGVSPDDNHRSQALRARQTDERRSLLIRAYRLGRDPRVRRSPEPNVQWKCSVV